MPHKRMQSVCLLRRQTIDQLMEIGMRCGHTHHSNQPSRHHVLLSPAGAQALARSGIVEVQPGQPSGCWRVRDRGYVGATRDEDIEVRIAPKSSVDRLLFLAGYATSRRHWRDEQLRLGEAPQLVPALAEALCANRARPAAGPSAGLPHG
jgi:hypothetical protein